MSKTAQKKWNRVHFFKRKKSGKTVGHPVYIYGSSKMNYKYLTFTHMPKTGCEQDYERLKHNIDPAEDGIRSVYVKKKFDVTRKDAFRDPDKKYRIHPDDVNTIKKYKK